MQKRLAVILPVLFLSALIFPAAYGQTGWIPLSTGTTEVLNSIHFPADSVGYVVGKNGIVLKSTDSGTTWNNLPSGISDHLEAVFFINPDVGFAGGWSAD